MRIIIIGWEIKTKWYNLTSSLTTPGTLLRDEFRCWTRSTPNTSAGGWWWWRWLLTLMSPDDRGSRLTDCFNTFKNLVTLKDSDFTVWVILVLLPSRLLTQVHWEWSFWSTESSDPIPSSSLKFTRSTPLLWSSFQKDVSRYWCDMLSCGHTTSDCDQ